MSGKKHMRASLSCFGMGERGVPSLSRWRKVLAVQTFLSAGACEESAAGAWGSRRVWTRMRCLRSGHYIMGRAAGE